MTPFRDYPIKQKLMALILVITAGALLLSAVILVIVDGVLFHRYLTRDLSTFSQVIADNSTASLTFEDPESATEILAALRARPPVMAACLFRNDGSLLAQYLREGSRQSCGPAPRNELIRSTSNDITLARPVVLKGERIGSLTIVYDLAELKGRVQIWGATVICVLVLSSLAVLLLSARLRTMFVTPILDLAETAGLVSKSRNYSVRASGESRDEVGQLAAAFNEMLSGIERRDSELQKTLLEREEALSRLSRVNSELKRSNEELARSNQDLERFAFIASHDMQEPLRMVTLYAQLLVKRSLTTDPELLQYRRYITEGTTRMRELIADLLSYVELTTAPSEAHPVDLNHAVQKVKENLRMLIEESGAVVTVESLPVVTIHEAHVVSLLQNLISNAIKYRSEKTPVIRVSAELVNSAYRFEVADNGVGIAPQYHDQIFLAFKRLHGKDIQGTGIGLAICQRIVERYGGRIWVESDVGQGSSFKFTLPQTVVARTGTA
jgi:signal transduction histidine kinase